MTERTRRVNATVDVLASLVVVLRNLVADVKLRQGSWRAPAASTEPVPSRAFGTAHVARAALVERYRTRRNKAPYLRAGLEFDDSRIKRCRVATAAVVNVGMYAQIATHGMSPHARRSGA
jgi:hypothetical protein